MVSLTPEQFVDVGICIAAAVLADMDRIAGVPAHRGHPSSVQLWIPLNNGAKAAFMCADLRRPDVIPDEVFRESLKRLLLQPPRVLRMPHKEALEVFERQRCSLTVRRISVLNQTCYDMWEWAGYHGLILPKQEGVTTLWESAADVRLAVLTECAASIRFIFPPDPLGGVLIAPPNAVFVPDEHLQVLRIAAESLRPAQGYTIPLSGAKFVAESEMRFSRRIFDFAFRFSATGRAWKTNYDGSLRGSVLLLSGPSASGKTTFANRLSLALRSFGLSALTVSMDEYYRDSKADPNYPRNSDGTPNHELVECLNLDALCADINALLTYEAVELPQFDMVNSKPKPKTGKHLVSLPRGGPAVIILEGIFALHPTFVEMIKTEDITKLFVMPLATLGATELVTLSNQTARLLRRISRDYLHRGRNARASIARLPGVQKGEDESIFPLLRTADYVFNSFVDFEPGILRVHTAPLLKQIDPLDSTYGTGQWLLSLLDGFAAVSDRRVAQDSLVREFIGESIFDAESVSTHLDNRAAHLLGKRFSFTKSLPRSFHDYKSERQASPVPCILDALTRQMLRDSSGSSGSGEDSSCGDDDSPRGAGAAAEGPLLADDEVLAVMNNRTVVSLNLPLEGSDYFHGADLRPLKLATHSGLAAYRETALLLLHVAAKHVLGHHRRVVVVHRFVEEGDRHCVCIQSDGDEPLEMSMEERDNIYNKLVALTTQDHRIEMQYVSPSSAVELFLKHHMPYSVRLIESSTRAKVLVATLCGIPMLGLKLLLPSTKYIHAESLTLEPLTLAATAGFATEWTFTIACDQIVTSPELSSNTEVRLRRQPVDTDATRRACNTRHDSFAAHKLHCLGDVNNAIFLGKAGAMVSIDESLQFRYVFELLQVIEQRGIRIVFIAGASASGKSQVMSQLRHLLEAHNFTTSTLSTDDYYRNLSDEDYPQSPAGEKNTESVEALRLPLLQQHIHAIAVLGEDVDAPVFNVGAGLITSSTRKIRGLGATRSVLLVEGLFALCPKVVDLVAKEPDAPSLLRVLVHPMPLLNVDELHVMSSTRLRLLRRIVRDYNQRGRTAKETLERRKMVQDGEVQNTLPYVGEADVVVNASCVHELSALRGTCEMLLNFVPDSLTDGGDAVSVAFQLKALLSWVCSLPETRVPRTAFVTSLIDPTPDDE